MKFLDENEMFSFRTFLSQYLELELTNIEIEINRDNDHSIQILKIKSHPTRIHQIISSKKLIHFGVHYPYGYIGFNGFNNQNEKTYQIELSDEMDCILKIQKLQPKIKTFANEMNSSTDLVDIIMAHVEVEYFQKEMDEAVYCKENNYWTCHGPPPILK